MSCSKKQGGDDDTSSIPFVDAVCPIYSDVGYCPSGDSCSYFHCLPDHRRGWNNFPKDKLTVRDSEYRRRVDAWMELESKILESKTKILLTIKIVSPLVMKDMEMWEKERLWPFTSYGPEGGKSLSEFKDKSYEEIRWELMTDRHDGLVTESLVNRYGTITRTRRFLAGSLAYTENALMLTHNLTDMNPFDPAIADIHFDDLNALSRAEETEEMSLILFGTKTPPTFRHCRVPAFRNKTKPQNKIDWKPRAPPQNDRFNWTRPSSLAAPTASCHHRADIPPMSTPVRPMNTPLGQHGQVPASTPLRSLFGEYQPVASSSLSRTNHGAPLGWNSERREVWKRPVAEQRQVSTSMSRGCWKEMLQENGRISSVLKEMQLLHTRNKALEAHVRTLQQTKGPLLRHGDCRDEESEMDGGGVAVDDDPVQPQIDTLLGWDNATEAGIRGSTNQRGQEEDSELCTLLDTLHVSRPVSTPTENGEEDGSGEVKGNQSYLQPPDCIIS